MSNCFSCGRTFKGSVNELLNIYKKQYLKNGAEYYFYKLSDKGDVFICNKSSFKTIFKTQIKPNFNNGSEYAHIKEYNV